jgi:hypothetical protein
MKSTELWSKIGSLRSERQKTLNDLVIWSSFARGALDTAKNDTRFLKQKRFKVPSNVEGKEVTRTADQLRAIAKGAVNRDIYYSVFVYAVAQVEAFIGEVLFEILSFDNRRIKTRIKGIDHTSKVEVSEIVDATSREEIISSIIRKELAALFYAAPALQMEYFQSVTGVKLPKEIIGQWLEIKATRDIIVHNSGVANSVYLKKAGNNGRASDGDVLPMDEKYFGNAIASMKSLIGKTSSVIQEDLKKASQQPIKRKRSVASQPSSSKQAR